MSYTFETLKNSIVGYKKVKRNNGGGERIVVLIIPAGAKVGYDKEAEKEPCVCKFRASEAFVAKGSGKSLCEPWFKYNEGEVVKPDSFSLKPYVCSSGIHFFLWRQEAKDFLY